MKKIPAYALLLLKEKGQPLGGGLGGMRLPPIPGGHECNVEGTPPCDKGDLTCAPGSGNSSPIGPKGPPTIRPLR